MCAESALLTEAHEHQLSGGLLITACYREQVHHAATDHQELFTLDLLRTSQDRNLYKTKCAMSTLV